MPTFSDGESGASVRSKINAAITKVDGIAVSDADVTLNVPTDYSTFQSAFNEARGYVLEGTAKVNVNGGSTQAWDASVVTIRGDHSGTVLTSAGSSIQVPAGFTSTDYGLNLDESCHGLTFETKLDMNGTGRGGINALDAVTSLFFQPGSGVINSGNNGSDPKGANLMTSGKVVCYWDAGTQTGADFSGSASRGVWVTYGGNFGGKYCDFSGTGTSRDIGDDHAGLFVSRGATAHADNSDFSGSKMGLRVGRARGNARDSNFTNIDGHAVFVFETGVATVSNGDFSGSGYWTGSVNYSVLYRAGSGANRPQGGGVINAESSTFNNCVGDIAECKGSDSIINIDNSSGTGLEGAVAVVSGGLVSGRSTSFTASATCRASQMVQVANAGEFEGLGSTLDGNSVVDYGVRVSDGGRAYLRGATLSNFVVSPLNFGGGEGTIYVKDITLDGTSGYFPNGVALGPGAVFATLQEAYDAVNLFGFILPNGFSFRAAGLDFTFKSGATGIPAMPGVTSAGKGSSSIDLYVSPTGTGDGNSVSSPCTLDDAENLTKELLRAHGSLDVTVNLAAGTYTDPSRWNFDNDGWAFGDGNLIIQGPDAPDGINTAIISSASVSSFLRCLEPTRSEIRVKCVNLHFSGYTTTPVDLRLNTQITMIGCSSDAPAGLVTCRNGIPEVYGHPVGTAVATGGQKYRVVTVASADWSSIGAGNPVSVGDVITATSASADISSLGTVAPLTKISGFTDVAINFQDCYGVIGDEKLSGGEPVARGFDFDGTGTAIQCSRGAASTYIVGNYVTAAAGLVSVSRNARVRTQANELVGPTSFCIERDRTCMWNNDEDYLDDFSGAGVGVPVLKISVPDSQGGEQEGPLAIFQRKSRRDVTVGPNLPNYETSFTNGDVAEVKQFTNSRDWSAIATAVTGTITNVGLGDIVQFTADQFDIYNQGLGSSSYGTAYKLTTSITSGDVVKIATAGADYSGTGGPASSTKGDYYVATSSGSAPASAYVYDSHRGTQTVANGDEYFCVIAGDYSSVGGSASASVGDKFTATSGATLAGQLAVVPAEQGLHDPNDGGDLNWRLYRVPMWFWLPADTPYMRGRFNFEYAGGNTPDVFTLRHDLGTVTMWTVPLEKSGTGVDRFSVEWEVYGRGYERDTGVYSLRATEPAAESDGSTVLKMKAGDTDDSFDSSMATPDNDFVSARLFCTHDNLDAEIRLTALITEGAY